MFDSNVNKTNKKEFDKRRIDALLVEYQTAQDYALQADSVAWQIGSILIGGALLFLSLIVNGEAKPLFLFGGVLLVNLLLMCWLLFFQGQYQIRRMKLHRIQQIEYAYKLKQNYFWEKGRSDTSPTQGIYRTYGPGGNVVTEVLYCIISFGFPSFSLITLFTFPNYHNLLSIFCVAVSFLIPIFTLIWYDRKANEFQKYMKDLKKIDPIDSEVLDT